MIHDQHFKKRLMEGSPFPVAYSLRQRLGVGDNEIERIENTTKQQLEAILFWVASVSLAAYRYKGLFSRKLNRFIQDFFTSSKAPTYGVWAGLIRNIFNEFNQWGVEFPIPQLEKPYFQSSKKSSRVARAIDYLVADRNTISHLASMGADQKRVFIAKMQKNLDLVFQCFADFLLKFHPVYLVSRSTRINLKGPSNDFFPLNSESFGPNQEDCIKRIWLVGDSQDFLFPMDPFFFLLGEEQCAFLISYGKENSKAGGFRVRAHIMQPASEEYLDKQTLMHNQGLVEELGRLDEGFCQFNRATPPKFKKSPAFRIFKTMLPEMVDHRSRFLGREGELFEARKWVNQLRARDVDSKVLIITSEMGMGKSGFLANLAMDQNAIFHFTAPYDQRNLLLSIYESLGRQIVQKYKVGNAYSSNHQTSNLNSLDMLGKLLQIIRVEDNPLIIIIDNLDGFKDHGRELLQQFPFPLPVGVGLVISARELPKIPSSINFCHIHLSGLDRHSMAEIVKMHLSEEPNCDVDNLSESLQKITMGSPLILRMFLGDRLLLKKISLIEKPEDVFRPLIERFDGRLDEDLYEMLLCFLSITQKPFKIHDIAHIVKAKVRKIHSFTRAIKPYLRLNKMDEVSFSSPQISEYLTNMPDKDGVDSGLLYDTIRLFIEFLTETEDEVFIKYRRNYMPILISRLPKAEGKKRLESWFKSPDFKDKLRSTKVGYAPHEDLRIYLDVVDGKLSFLVDLIQSLLKEDSEAILINTLLCLYSLREIPLGPLAETLQALESNDSDWVQSTLCRLKRKRYNDREASDRPKLLIFDFTAHFPLICQFSDEQSPFHLQLTDSSAERREWVWKEEIPFIVTTLDEIGSINRMGFHYLPFYRLFHSTGLDAIVVARNNQEKIFCVEDLKGKSVGFEAGSISEFWLKQVLENHGLEIDDVESRPFVSIEDCCRELYLNKIDAGVLWEPWVSRLQGSPIFESGDFEQVIQDALCVRSDLAAQYLDEAALLVQAWETQACKIKTEQLLVITHFFHSSHEEIRDQFKKIKFLTWQESRDLFLNEDEPGNVLGISNNLARLQGSCDPLFNYDRARKYILDLDKRFSLAKDVL